MFSSMWLYVTEGCNLRCPYCFNPDALFTRKATIDEAAYRDIIDNFLMYREAAGTKKRPQIVLFGGEPTLYPDLLEGIMAYGHEQTEGKIRFRIITNGTRLARLRERVMDWRSRFSLRLQLSIDGSPHFETPRTVGVNPSAYHRAIAAAFEFLLEERIPFTIRATMTPERVAEYAANYQYFVNLYSRNPDAKPVVVIMPDYLGSRWKKRHFEIMEDQARNIVSFVHSRFIETGELLRESFTERALRLLYQRENDIEATLSSPSLCGFSSGLCGVAPDGEMYACHRVYGHHKMRIGNLRTGDIDLAKQEAIASVVNGRAFLKPAHELPFRSCAQCDVGSACMAACPADIQTEETPKLSLRCSFVMYRFQSTFIRVVKETLWPLIMNDPSAKHIVAKRAGNPQAQYETARRPVDVSI